METKVPTWNREGQQLWNYFKLRSRSDYQPNALELIICLWERDGKEYKSFPFSSSLLFALARKENFINPAAEK